MIRGTVVPDLRRASASLNDTRQLAVERRHAGQGQRVEALREIDSRITVRGDPCKATAFLGYTHEYFFIAFICNDRRPGRIRAHMLARDSLSDDDNVQVMLDTFHDERRAFVFASNPLGIQADAMYSEQNGYDYSFDTVWDTWGRRTRAGYVVLVRIPFASLYFAKTAPGETRTPASSSSAMCRTPSRPTSAAQQSQHCRLADAGYGRSRASATWSGGRNAQVEPYTIARSLRQLNTINPIDPYFENKLEELPRCF